MLSLLATTTLVLAPALPQEKIYLTSGRVLEVRSVISETYSEVEYRTAGGRSTGTKDAAEVARIEHDLSSGLLDDYVAGLAMMEERGDFAGAIGAFEFVLEDERLMRSSRLSWVKAYALWNIARCEAALQNAEGTQAAVDRLLSEVPDTFFYGEALKLKAETTAAAGDKELARGFYRDLDRAVGEKGLPEKWRAWAELGLLILDEGKGASTKQRELQQIAEQYRGKHPEVASRAEVEIGNAMVEEGDYGRAEGFFRRILDGGGADPRTRASAWAGLGDCAYQRGLAAEEAGVADAAFREAALAHLRVVTLHKNVRRIVPRSMYYAAVAFDRMSGGAERSDALSIVKKMADEFGNSPWTEKAFEELRLRKPN